MSLTVSPLRSVWHTSNSLDRIRLTHNTTSVALADRPGGSLNSADLSAALPITFSDSATTAFGQQPGCTTIGAGSCLNTFFLPLEALSVFNDTNIIGVWLLTIEDAQSLDQGTLQNWTLNAEVAPVAVAVAEPGILGLLGLGLLVLVFSKIGGGRRLDLV